MTTGLVSLRLDMGRGLSILGEVDLILCNGLGGQELSKQRLCK